MNKVRQTCLKVKKLDHIEIKLDAIAQLVDSLELSEMRRVDSLFGQVGGTNADRFMALLVFNAINFCYWAEKDRRKWTVEIDGEELDGSIALVKILVEQIARSRELLDPHYLTKLSKTELSEMLNANIEIPMLTERAEQLNLLGKELIDYWQGDISILLKQSHNCAVRMLNRLSELECFSDVSKYKGSTIYFYKRAQLQIGMYNELLTESEGKGLRNMHALTAFADYKVPQILRHLGVLRYSDELAGKVDNYELIDEGSDLENEIRIATINAIEKMVDEFSKVGIATDPQQLDSVLWERAASNRDSMLPYHRSYTVAY